MRALELNLLQSDSIAGSTASGKAITRTVRLKMADNQRSVRMSQKKCRCKFSSIDKKKQKNTRMINEREKRIDPFVRRTYSESLDVCGKHWRLEVATAGSSAGGWGRGWLRE